MRPGEPKTGAATQGALEVVNKGVWRVGYAKSVADFLSTSPPLFSSFAPIQMGGHQNSGNASHRPNPGIRALCGFSNPSGEPALDFLLLSYTYINNSHWISAIVFPFLDRASLQSSWISLLPSEMVSHVSTAGLALRLLRPSLSGFCYRGVTKKRTNRSSRLNTVGRV